MNRMPVAVVKVGKRFEVRLGGRVIRIRTARGTWMLARFDTREAAEGYRWALVGDPPPPAVRIRRGSVTSKKVR